LGFQESMRAGIDHDHVIMYWIDVGGSSLSLSADFAAMIKKNIARSREDVARALKFSIPILLSPLSHAYFDVPYAEASSDPHQEEKRLQVGLRAYAPKTIAEAFDWDPAEVLGPKARLANLAGVSAAIWAETIKDFVDLTFMLLPRLAGMAEKGGAQCRSRHGRATASAWPRTADSGPTMAWPISNLQLSTGRQTRPKSNPCRLRRLRMTTFSSLGDHGAPVGTLHTASAS
jgi:hypothetical protein